MSWSKFTLDTLIDNWGYEAQYSNNTNTGAYDELGIYQPPEDSWETDFAVLAVMTNNTIMPAELGAYTAQDKYYVTRANLQLGTWVRAKSQPKIQYKIHERADFSVFDNTSLLLYKVKLNDGRLDNSDA